MYREADTDAYFSFLSDKKVSTIAFEVRGATGSFGEEEKFSKEEFRLSYWGSKKFQVERGSMMEFTGKNWDSLVLYVTYFFDMDLSSNPPRTTIIKRSALSSITDLLPGITVETWKTEHRVKLRGGAINIDAKVTTERVPERDSLVVEISEISLVNPLEESIPEMASKVRRISTAHYQNRLNENLPKAKKFPGGKLESVDPSPRYDLVKAEQIRRRKLAWSLLSPPPSSSKKK